MYHIVPVIGFSDYIVVHWDCHGVMRLVLSNGHIFNSTTVRSGLPDGSLVATLP